MIRGLVLLFLVLPTLLSAQTLTVRSGEHGPFTRVVVPLPQGSDYSIAQEQPGGPVTLTLSATAAQFDTSQAFARIDRSRVADIQSAGNGQLRIDLACACQGQAFVTGGNLLVVDIAPAEPGAAPPLTPAAQHAQPAEPAAPAPSGPNPLLADLARVRLGEAPGVGPRKAPDPLLPRLPNRPPEIQSVHAGSGDSPANTPEDATPGPSTIGDQIAADLAAAATAGLLDPAIRPQVIQINTPPDAQIADDQPYQPDNSEVARDLAAALSGADHSGLKGGRVSVGGDGCVRESRLDLASWTEPDADINSVLAARRGTIFGEFDRIDNGALEEYARALLHFGFGAEARSILRLGEERPDTTLLALSYLVDGLPDPTERFKGQASCDGPAAMWAVLSGSAETVGPVDHKAVLRGLDALPPDLQGFLGPLLAERLTAFGYTNSARDILRRLQRSQGGESESVALQHAQMDLAAGNLEDAANRLKPLSEQGSPQTPDAIVARVALADATQDAVPQRIVELAGAYAAEMRNSDQGVALWQAHVRSLLLNGAFEQAFDVIANAGDIPAETVEKARADALAQLSTKAEDLTFLKMVIPPIRVDLDHPIAEATTLDIAERLVKLGMSDAALDYADHISNPTDQRRLRLIKAEANLDLSRPEEAEINLIGLKGEDVTRLRAEARRQMGDHVLAEQIFKEMGQQSDAATAAWLSGDWAAVAANSDSVLSQAAQMVQQDQASVNPAEPTLQDAEQLSQQSSNSLDTIRSLLEATRVPQ